MVLGSEPQVCCHVQPEGTVCPALGAQICPKRDLGPGGSPRGHTRGLGGRWRGAAGSWCWRSPVAPQLWEHAAETGEHSSLHVPALPRFWASTGVLCLLRHLQCFTSMCVKLALEAGVRSQLRLCRLSTVARLPGMCQVLGCLPSTARRLSWDPVSLTGGEMCSLFSPVSDLSVAIGL